MNALAEDLMPGDRHTVRHENRQLRALRQADTSGYAVALAPGIRLLRLSQTLRAVFRDRHKFVLALLLPIISMP